MPRMMNPNLILPLGCIIEIPNCPKWFVYFLFPSLTGVNFLHKMDVHVNGWAIKTGKYKAKM